MWKGWLMVDEWNGRIKLEWPSWPNWNNSFSIFQNELRTISSTSVRAGRQPSDFPTHQLSSVDETSWSLNRSGRVHTSRWGEILQFLYFPSAVCAASFPLGNDAMFLIFRTNQCSGNVSRTLCTEGVSLSRRKEYFYMCLKVTTIGVQ